MIVAVAFCPHPPVLVPDVARSAAAELADLRAACLSAVSTIASSGRPIAVVGAGDHSRAFDGSARGTFAGFGVELEVALGAGGAASPELPLSLTVGAWLLREAGAAAEVGLEVAPDGSLPAMPDGDRALLVMGDGSARRSTAAPGYFDERAEAFDTAVADALRSGDPAQLHPDVALGAELLAAGTPAWNAVGDLAAGARFDAEVLYADAPYGVGYVVATWT